MNEQVIGMQELNNNLTTQGLPYSNNDMSLINQDNSLKYQLSNKRFVRQFVKRWNWLLNSFALNLCCSFIETFGDKNSVLSDLETNDIKIRVSEIVKQLFITLWKLGFTKKKLKTEYEDEDVLSNIVLLTGQCILDSLQRAKKGGTRNVQHTVIKIGENNLTTDQPKQGGMFTNFLKLGGKK